jgi:hypothetical protein
MDCYSPTPSFKKLLIVTATYGIAVLLAQLAFYTIINGNRNTRLCCVFANVVTYGTAVVTASVILKELLKVTVTCGIVASLADLKFA